MWGKHVIIDMTAGDKERVKSAEHIHRFVETLVETIGMKAYGPPVLEHFAGICQTRRDIPSSN